MKLQLGQVSSLVRPAWTQADLHAYRHLHLTRQSHKHIVENHFVDTHGFRTMQDFKHAQRKG